MLHIGSMSTLICLCGALVGIIVLTQVPHYLYSDKNMIVWVIEQGYDFTKIVICCCLIYYCDYIQKLPF